MKFSETTKETWPELQPYVDTCLLPVTGLTGTESPYAATEALERLKELMDAVEIPFRGRVVAYPAFHYTDGEEADARVGVLSARLKEAGFRFVIAASPVLPLSEAAGADLLLSPVQGAWPPDREKISESVRQMWKA